MDTFWNFFLLIVVVVLCISVFWGIVGLFLYLCERYGDTKTFQAIVIILVVGFLICIIFFDVSQDPIGEPFIGHG
jgi:hypothetical protein